MSFRCAFLIASAVTSLAAAPVSADPQRGHATMPPPHGGPKAVAPAAVPRPTPALTTPAMNPVAAKISTLPRLDAKITALLPPNMTLDAASAGFKNQGQFIAALHVSQNLGIPFDALKSDMTTRHMSLGQSIQDLRSTADASREAKKGA